MDTLDFKTFASFWSATELDANLLVTLNMLGALVLGLLVGYERSFRGRAAGMRTYGLVCMASCALVSIMGYHGLWYGGSEAVTTTSDPTRVIQGIVSGIGFLGAGVIMRDGLNISGLTTAASIWSVSVIGILVGVGFYGGAIMLSFLSFIFMMWGSKIEKIFPFRHAISVHMSFSKKASPNEEQLSQIVKKHGYEIAKGSFGMSESNALHEWHFVVVSAGSGKNVSLVKLGQGLSKIEGIENFKLNYARN